MSGNADRTARVVSPNTPVRTRLAAPITTVGRSSDTPPILGQFAQLVRFSLSQGFVELAEELADRIAPIIQRQEGFRSFTLLTDETSGEYIFLTYWETLEAVHAYERSADEWRVRDILAEHLTTVPEIDVFQLHNLPLEAMPPDEEPAE